MAVPFLKLLKDTTDLCAAVTQPDRPSGRGLKLSPSPVKTCAQELGVQVFNPKFPAEIAENVRTLAPVLGVAVAYGRILKKEFLASTKLGFLNVHFSLLPAYRGAAPVQWALIRGETETGVTVFWLDEGMDTGPVLVKKTLPISPDDNAATLMERLVVLGVEALRESLELVRAGNPPRVPQSGEASYAALLDSSLSRIDFNCSAREAHNTVRGLALGPCARVSFPGGEKPVSVQLVRTSLENCDYSSSLPPGSITRVERGRGFYVKCIDSELLVLEVRPEGKKTMSGWDFLNGFKLKAGDAFALPCGMIEADARTF